MLKIKNMNSNSVIRQGDKQPRTYELVSDDNLAGKSAKIRLMTTNFTGIAYETTATVSSENKISFSIDDIIPAREYRLEITVDDYVFPSRATDGRFDIDPSSHGQEVNIIQIIGKDEIVREVKARVENELEPLVTSLVSAQQAELDRQAQEEAREVAEGQRVESEAGRQTAEQQRVTADAGREAKLTAKADKSYVDTELAKKANKKQEEWITPMLLNGWTGDLKLRKDDLGTVHITGAITAGITTLNTPVFSLPTGYGPSRLVPLSLITSSSPAMKRALYVQSGIVYTQGNNELTQGTSYHLNETFKVGD